MKISKKRAALVVALAITATTALQIRQDIPAAELNAKYTTPASKFKSIAGANLHYRDEGQGTPIILLHGTAASLNTWDGWAKELSKTHRVLRLDLPGFGLTGRNQTDTYTIAYYSELVQHFMDELGIDKAHIAGSSLGGQIAYDFAATHPERVQKLILVSPTGVTTANDKSISMPFMMAQTPLVKESLKYITPRFIVEKSLKEVYGDDSRLTPEAISLSHDLLLREGNREAFILRMNTVDTDNLPKLKQVKAPTLILWGEADAWVPAQNASRFLQDIKGSQLKTYAGAGHIPMEELAQETVKDAMQFLGSEVAVNK
ncbi:pimeloyl-ACP methyl ester carboxylesterase [Pontibacter aydingkolensis]|uniref:Alpha/beta hydrolase n=1 Tax=Pontibacter aydingkolensis TaxID=1911536 RepID=A0ABS7CYF2_9BACT|nr:alpha/beta hydrolase [Pontibacter aydingkolensis]MBW7468884.1 alpha/beta hydrolase [Pontibacter aydingkolensis]